jgi:hypothetical protein
MTWIDVVRPAGASKSAPSRSGRRCGCSRPPAAGLSYSGGRRRRAGATSGVANSPPTRNLLVSCQEPARDLLVTVGRQEWT